MGDDQPPNSDLNSQVEKGLDDAANNRVKFDGACDAYNPQNWSFNKKVLNTFLYGLTTLSSTWASAA